ncbi:MAG: hypothetical protein KDC67_05750 [Ignavibacteriae bacterium]|nr:hypothetical protein [Ignavibacteriota bacterium]
MKVNKNNTIMQMVLLLCITLSSFAQDLNLTYSDGNVSLPLNTNSSMTVDPISGNVNVTTSFSSEDIGNELGLQPTGIAPNINFNIDTNGTTSANVTATISNDAVYCNKSGLWSGLVQSTPPTNYVTLVNQNNVTSNGTYSLTCANSFGITSNSGNVTNIVSVNPPVVNVSANPTSVTSGGSSTITWSATNTPTNCTFSSDWPVSERNIPPNSNPVVFVVNNITNSKTFTATCSNSAGSDNDTATVSISGGSAWPSCAGSAAAILGGNEDRTVLSPSVGQNSLPYDGLYEHFQGMDNSFPWPGNWGDNIHLSLTKNQYIAAKFTTSNTNYEAKFQLTATNSIEGPGPQAKTMTISTCPGDFNEHLGQVRCKTNTSVLNWSTTSSPSIPGFFCELEKNTTYYINIVHSDNSEGDNYQTTDCTTTTTTYCGILASQSEVN